jgi:hypothetical protein
MLVAFRHAEAAVIQYVVGCLSQALPKAEVHGGIASEDALMHSPPLEMNGPGSPSRDEFVSRQGFVGWTLNGAQTLLSRSGYPGRLLTDSTTSAGAARADLSSLPIALRKDPPGTCTVLFVVTEVTEMFCH